MRVEDNLAGDDSVLLGFAVDHSPAIFYVADYDGQRAVRFISPNVERILGYAPSRFIGPERFGRKCIHPDDLDGYQRGIDQLGSRGRVTHIYRFRHREGHFLWFRDDLRYVGSEDGDARFVGCMIDITAEKEVEGRLMESERLNDAIIASSQDGLITINEDGRILEFNPSAERMFGYKRSDVIGQKLSVVCIPEEKRDAHEQGLKRMLETGFFKSRYGRIESEAIKANGARFPVEITISAANVGGRVIVAGTIRDISERRAAEAERQRLTKLLNEAIESLPHGFSIVDADHNMALCNSAFARPYKVDKDQIIGMPRQDAIKHFLKNAKTFDGVPLGEQEAKEDVKFIADRMLTSDVDPIEIEMKDGEWWLVTGNKISDGGYVTVRTDITEQKEAQRAIAESENRIRQVLESCPAPIGMTYMDTGQVIYESPAAKAMLGRGRGDKSESAIDYYVDPNDRDIYINTLRKHGRVDNMEMLYRRLDGSSFWALVSAQKISYGGEDVVVYSAIDMTERHGIEAELNRQRDALFQSEKLSALGELLAGVAHELNNPLSVLVGQALLLKETTVDENIAARAEKISNAADRCARIVKTFLAMARQQPINRRAHDVNELIESAIELTAYQIRGNGIELSTRFDRSLPSLWIDGDQITQVITNLIINAVQAIGESESDDRRLRVTSNFRKRANEVVIKVIDNGPGVPEHIASRIFEPFYTTKEVGVGTGMGLAFCHRVMEFHGGRIKIENGDKGGAAFVIRLPIMVPQETNLSLDKTRNRTPGSLRVLVIDDEPDVVNVISEILNADGHSVTSAINGAQALTFLGNQEFDVVLSDLRMPELDGPNLFKVLQERHPAMCERIAFVTGDTMSPKVSRFMATSGRPYIEKPITPAEVRELVATILRQTA
ncbi:MAG: PAS domain S-box protein [Rhodospirillales bacterium]